jgi:hypothetical protein
MRLLSINTKQAKVRRKRRDTKIEDGSMKEQRRNGWGKKGNNSVSSYVTNISIYISINNNNNT